MILFVYSKRKIDAEMFSEQLTKNPPFGERPIPQFLKNNKLDILE